VGWIARGDRQAVKDAHVQEQLAHADSHAMDSEKSEKEKDKDNREREKDRDREKGDGKAQSASLGPGMPKINKGSNTPPRKAGGHHGGGRAPQHPHSSSMPGNPLANSDKRSHASVNKVRTTE
jgi:hypothetical protein